MNQFTVFGDPKTPKERLWQNQRHIHTPEVGDAWFERVFTPVLVVLEVLETSIVFCKTTKDTDNGTKWTWNLDIIHDLSREEFAEFVQYNSNSGFWCDVYPYSHAWAAALVLSEEKPKSKEHLKLFVT